MAQNSTNGSSNAPRTPRAGECYRIDSDGAAVVSLDELADKHMPLRYHIVVDIVGAGVGAGHPVWHQRDRSEPTLITVPVKEAEALAQVLVLGRVAARDLRFSSGKDSKPLEGEVHADKIVERVRRKVDRSVLRRRWALINTSHAGDIAPKGYIFDPEGKIRFAVYFLSAHPLRQILLDASSRNHPS